MARPAQRFKTLRSIAFWIAFLLLLFPGCAAVLFVFFLVSPYTLFYYSSHWGLRKDDFAAVQLYLDHFEALHPNLVAHVSRYFASPAYSQEQAPQAIKFWPTLTRQRDIEGVPLIIIIRTTKYTFSVAAGLFFSLEACGFRRKDLYLLLQRDVESRIASLSAEDKANFQRAMDNVCEHNLFAKFAKTTGSSKGFTLPSDAGEKMVPVRHSSVEWIIDEPGALVVPMDSSTYFKLQNLTMRVPVWKRVMSDADLANGLEGKWQKVDLR